MRKQEDEGNAREGDGLKMACVAFKDKILK